MNQEFVLPRRRRRIRPYLDLTAMIDTVFNLLIFFAVASTFAGATTGLELRLPSAETARLVPDRVVLTILPNQPTQVNGVPVSSEGLTDALYQATNQDREAQIVVLADSAVPYEQLITVLDIIRLAEYHRIALAASPARDERMLRP